jgi:hypothetical protein
VDDLDKGFDATIETARQVLADTERLRDEAGKASQALKEWRSEKALDETITERFLKSLSPEDRKKAQEEQDAFERQTALEIEEALQKAKAEATPGRVKKPKGRRYA